MSNNKNIDRLFQEKFKDFEAHPNDEVWENIADKLNHPKKKRRVLAIWWQLGGIAAALILFFSVGSLFFNSDTDAIKNNTIVNTKDTPTPKNISPAGSNKTSVDHQSTTETAIENEINSVATTDNSNKNKTEKSIMNSSNLQKKSANSSPPEGVDPLKINTTVAKNNSTKTDKSEAFNSININKNNSKVTIAKNSKDSRSETFVDRQLTKTASKDKTNTVATTGNNSLKNKAREEPVNPSNLQKKLSNSVTSKEVNSSKKSALIVKNNSTKIDKNRAFNSINRDKSDSKVVVENSKKSLSKTEITTENTKIAALADLNKDAAEKEITTDITDKKETDKLSLDEVIAKNLENTLEKDIEDNKNFKKWQITPNVAPVFFNNLGSSGSTIGSQFNDNVKTGETNVSYGINAKYAVSKRFKVRAGVNKVSLGFNTNDVLLFNSPTASANGDFASFRPSNNTFLRNVNLNSSSRGTAVVNANEFRAALAPGTSENASIGQQFAFIEVPVELEYAVVDKKFGLRFIGGFSALFLNENDVFSTLNGQSTLIGEATNINNTSYSANFGLGINYGFSRTLNFNIEPTFKYQLNTFNNVTGDFQPYFIGIYSGFTFKF